LGFSLQCEFFFFLWVVYFLGLWVDFVVRDWLKYDRENEESAFDKFFGFSGEWEEKKLGGKNNILYINC
jgi:hypothetical protein